MADETYAPAYPATYQPPPYPPAPGRGLPGWAIALIACAAGLVVVLIVAAIAIPVFLDQREKASAAATTVRMPATVAGLTQTPLTPQLRDQAQALRDSVAVGMPDPKVSVFTDSADSHRLVVMAGKVSTVLRDREQAAAVRGFWQGVQRSLGGQTTLGTPAERPAGTLGGTLSCAAFNPAGVTGEICVAVDPGAMLVTIDILKGEGAAIDPTLPTTVREAVVKRG